MNVPNFIWILLAVILVLIVLGMLGIGIDVG